MTDLKLGIYILKRKKRKENYPSFTRNSGLTECLEFLVNFITNPEIQTTVLNWLLPI